MMKIKMNLPILAIAIGLIVFSGTDSVWAQAPSDAELTNLMGQVQKLEVRMDTEWYRMLLAIALGSGLVIVGFLGIRRSILSKVSDKIDKQAEELIQKQLPAILKKEIRKEFESYKKVIVQMLEEIDFDKIVKNKYKTLIIGSSEGDARNVKDFMACFGFDAAKITTMAMKPYPAISTKEYDLVIFDNWGEEEILPGEIEKYIDGNPTTTFFLHQAHDKKRFSSNPGQLNFANTRLTLYPRIMETLMYIHFAKAKDIFPS